MDVAKVISEAKSWHNKRLIIRDDPNVPTPPYRDGWMDEDGGGSSFVVLCTYHSIVNDVIIHQNNGSQACHANVPYKANGTYDSFVCMLDHIQGSSREKIKKLQSEEESIQFLQYFMDHPIFSRSFLEHDAKKAFKERIMVRDLKSLPSNVCMFAIIATRALWESFQNFLPRRFNELVNMGLSKDFAYLMSFYVRKAGTDWIVEATRNNGHISLATNTASSAYIRNYLRHNPVVISDDTLCEKGATSKTDVYNVFAIFENSYRYAYGNTYPDLFCKEVEKFFMNKKVNEDTLKQFEEKVRD